MKKTRIICMPAVDRTVPLRQYIKAIKRAKENPDSKFDHGLTTWWPVTGREIMRQFLRGVNDRINQGIPCIKRGR